MHGKLLASFSRVSDGALLNGEDGPKIKRKIGRYNYNRVPMATEFVLAGKVEATSLLFRYVV